MQRRTVHLTIGSKLPGDEPEARSANFVHVAGGPASPRPKDDSIVLSQSVRSIRGRLADFALRIGAIE
jgi:hypothetical protein